MNITQIERIDEIPLLYTKIEKMDVVKQIDEQYPAHGNWQGASIGQIIAIWLCFILSEGDHRLNRVEDWVSGLLTMFQRLTWNAKLRALDFSDDRLAAILDRLGCNEDWDEYETAQNRVILRVYELKTDRVRLDTTTVKSYVDVNELFQFGHSKEHRPDLPQLKVSLSSLDPMGLPLTTTIVSGEKADDPLYVPEIRKVQRTLQKKGVLHVGDCKMSSIQTRTYIVVSKDYYLMPLSGVQMPAAELSALLEPVWSGEQALTELQRPGETEDDDPDYLGEGFVYTVKQEGMLDGVLHCWEEKRMVVLSVKHAQSQQKSLDSRLIKAETDLLALNLTGKGRKKRNEAETRQAVETILAERRVKGLIDVTYQVDVTETVKKARGKLPERTERIERIENVTISLSRNTEAYNNIVRRLGWRVFATNAPSLDVNDAVLAYREEFIIEHDFRRLRGKVLGITPLYLNDETRIKGLVRLLCIALRVLCLFEFSVRQALEEKNEKLCGIYAGNPKRSTARPTTEMMLKAFKGVHFTTVKIGDLHHNTVTKLNAVQLRILSLLGLTESVYVKLGGASSEVG